MTLKPILAALLVTAALPAAAQTAPAPDGAPMMHRDPAMMQQRHAAMQQHFADMQRRHADDLALLLDLKPAQRPALDAYLASSHHGMGEGPMARRPEGPPNAERAAPSFTQRLDRMDEAAGRRAEAEHRRIAATKAFYTSLDPHQQQLFDAMMRLRHGGGERGHRGMGGGRMRGGHPGGPGPMGRPAPQD